MKVFVFLLCLVAALVVFIGGCNMTSIRSQAGNTTMEACYNSMGWAMIGLSIFLLAVGLSIAFLIPTTEAIERNNIVSTPASKPEEKGLTLREYFLGPNESKQKTVTTQLFACPICGAKLDPEAAKGNFCSNCGANLKSWGVKDLEDDGKK